VTDVPGGVERPGYGEGKIEHCSDSLSFEQDVEWSDKTDDPEGDEETEVDSPSLQPREEVEPLKEVPQQREKDEDPRIQSVLPRKACRSVHPLQDVPLNELSHQNVTNPVRRVSHLEIGASSAERCKIRIPHSDVGCNRRKVQVGKPLSLLGIMVLL
jgi:hypothetical protein